MFGRSYPYDVSPPASSHLLTEHTCQQQGNNQKQFVCVHGSSSPRTTPRAAASSRMSEAPGQHVLFSYDAQPFALRTVCAHGTFTLSWGWMMSLGHLEPPWLSHTALDFTLEFQTRGQRPPNSYQSVETNVKTNPTRPGKIHCHKPSARWS